MSGTNGNSIERLVRILSEKGPMRAGQLGQEMWGRPGDVIRPENNALTMHCRAAGRMLRRAERLRLVRCEDRGRYRLWSANADLTGNQKPGKDEPGYAPGDCSVAHPRCCSNDEGEDGICRNYDKRAKFRHEPCPHSRACYNWFDPSWDQPNKDVDRDE